ncbi:MAG: HEPN domain-containing protein [Chloroflexota bacterium]
MRSDTRNWIALADYDLESARHMLETGRYLYVVFYLSPCTRKAAQGSCNGSNSIGPG